MSILPVDKANYTLIFGTSANPPTGFLGHAGLVQNLRMQSRVPSNQGLIEVSAIWIPVVFEHPFKEKRKMLPFEHRLAMAHLNFDDLSSDACPVRVLDDERTLPRSPDLTLGTIDLLKHLGSSAKRRRFALVLGEDTISDVYAGRWKASDKILARYPLVAIARPGESTRAESMSFDTLAEVSSSALRDASQNSQAWRDVLRPSVWRYVRRHNLYSVRRPGGVE